MADKASIPLDHSMMRQASYDGTNFMQCSEPAAEHVPRVKAMTLRDDDIFLCTFPKSGTHWVYRVLDMLQRRSTDFYPRNPDSVYVDAQRIEDLDTLASPRVLTTHYPFTLLPDNVKDKRTKIVHVYRNPRATCMSAFWQMKATKHPGMPDLPLDQFVHMAFSPKSIYYGWWGWMDRAASYEKENPDVPIMHVAYEDMSLDPTGTVTKLAAFLEKDTSPQLVSDIVAACSFNKQKKAEENFDTNQKKFAFYRKGDMNDWKHHMTVAMNEKFEKKLQECAPSCQFSAKYV